MSERTYCICTNCGDIEFAMDGDTHGQAVTEYDEDGTPDYAQVQCGELKDIKTYVTALESRVSELEEREKAVEDALVIVRGYLFANGNVRFLSHVWDVDCSAGIYKEVSFGRFVHRGLIGRGATPNAALVALSAKLKEEVK